MEYLQLCIVLVFFVISVLGLYNPLLLIHFQQLFLVCMADLLFDWWQDCFAYDSVVIFISLGVMWINVLRNI